MSQVTKIELSSGLFCQWLSMSDILHLKPFIKSLTRDIKEIRVLRNPRNPAHLDEILCCWALQNESKKKEKDIATLE